ncbi:DUF3304 domain-containing protein [Massilia sp. TWR1-2-2]|uniref:DUF3304 domain-containing protein n=1 Tax=Massilia sp. TWR1-2-2 TaxID=2804584 RepID=UPI003CEE0F07
MNPISQKFRRAVIARVAFVLMVVALAACEKSNVSPPESRKVGSIVGANYTGNAINTFAVDGAWGGNVMPFSGGGGFVCCASYPIRWTPEFAVSVKWTRSDGRDAKGEWRMKALQKVVPVSEFAGEGNVYVLFLPDDQVKVYVSNVGIGNPNFPSKPGYPEDSMKGAK